RQVGDAMRRGLLRRPDDDVLVVDVADQLRSAAVAPERLEELVLTVALEPRHADQLPRVDRRVEGAAIRRELNALQAEHACAAPRDLLDLLARVFCDAVRSGHEPHELPRAPAAAVERAHR